jgi:hypothetical protein
MKTHILLFAMGLILSSFTFFSKPEPANSQQIPFKYASPIFGHDVVIHDQPSRDQGNVHIRSAFNGWLYAMYTYPNAHQGWAGYTILKSVDNGNSWQVIVDNFITGQSFITTADFVVTGTSTSNLKIFLVYMVSSSDSTVVAGSAAYLRFNAITGAFEDGANLGPCRWITIAGDFTYPATNSNPYSIGILYSEYISLTLGDSIKFLSSGDGGLSFNNRKGLAGTSKRFHKVSLTYGRSLSQNSGRYYAAWEEKENYNSNLGHIYTAHTEPYFNSSFTTPVMLDTLEASAYNKVKNPSIACQYNNVDNDSTDVTEIILFDKYSPSTMNYSVEGFYNMRSTASNHFNHLILNNSNDSRMQASITFNPFNSAFMTTCFDSTLLKLPYFKHDFNMQNPDSWQIVDASYNDSANIIKPYPLVALNSVEQQGACVWNAYGINGNGVSMFDAEYLINGGIIPESLSSGENKYRAYPNPCSDQITIEFLLTSKEELGISLNSILGEKITLLHDSPIPAGRHSIKIKIPDVPSGNYFLTFTTNTSCEALRIQILR